ncbi:ABC transporter permease [Kineosporia sp. J2-2]|uniref:ABC transporter permease n=1 Tax=Kineosporia corallincola TaxID=2835133 RepID=A0ABS5TFS9_9ACTN|nr:hypothetical protein [Kineosporia corallincola]MBT0768459.1 ABC transporter permease [Kineosporia corallincola]
MSTTLPAVPSSTLEDDVRPGRRPARFLGLALGGLLLLVLARYAVGAPGITASATWGSALRLTVPILVVALGGLYCERAGVINVGLEGMMVAGTWTGGLCGWHFGPWAALLGGMLGGLLVGAMMAFLCVELGLNQLVVGVAVNVVAAAAARFCSEIAFQGVDGGTIARSPRIDGALPEVGIPFLSGGFGTADALASLERANLPVLSQFAGIVGGLTRDVSLAALIGLALVPASAYLLWRTPFGLHWRAAGEEPAALTALGGHVQRTRWIAVCTGGALAGFAGGYLVLVSRAYVEGQTAGRGFIGLATLIFGNWTPSGLSAGAALFGLSDAVGLGRPETFRALLLVLGVVFAGLGVARLRSAGVRPALAPLLLGTAVLVVVAVVPLPAELPTAAPYLVTLAVLVVSGRTMRPPAALGRFVPRRTSRS